MKSAQRSLALGRRDDDELISASDYFESQEEHEDDDTIMLPYGAVQHAKKMAKQETPSPSVQRNVIKRKSLAQILPLNENGSLDTEDSTAIYKPSSDMMKQLFASNNIYLPEYVKEITEQELIQLEKEVILEITAGARKDLLPNVVLKLKKQKMKEKIQQRKDKAQKYLNEIHRVDELLSDYEKMERANDHLDVLSREDMSDLVRHSEISFKNVLRQTKERVESLTEAHTQSNANRSQLLRSLATWFSSHNIDMDGFNDIQDDNMNDLNNDEQEFLESFEGIHKLVTDSSMRLKIITESMKQIRNKFDFKSKEFDHTMGMNIAAIEQTSGHLKQLQDNLHSKARRERELARRVRELEDRLFEQQEITDGIVTRILEPSIAEHIDVQYVLQGSSYLIPGGMEMLKKRNAARGSSAAEFENFQLKKRIQELEAIAKKFGSSQEHSAATDISNLQDEGPSMHEAFSDYFNTEESTRELTPMEFKLKLRIDYLMKKLRKLENADMELEDADAYAMTEYVTTEDAANIATTQALVKLNQMVSENQKLIQDQTETVSDLTAQLAQERYQVSALLQELEAIKQEEEQNKLALKHSKKKIKDDMNSDESDQENIAPREDKNQKRSAELSQEIKQLQNQKQKLEHEVAMLKDLADKTRARRNSKAEPPKLEPTKSTANMNEMDALNRIKKPALTKTNSTSNMLTPKKEEAPPKPVEDKPVKKSLVRTSSTADMVQSPKTIPIHHSDFNNMLETIRNSNDIEQVKTLAESFLRQREFAMLLVLAQHQKVRLVQSSIKLVLKKHSFSELDLLVEWVRNHRRSVHKLKMYLDPTDQATIANYPIYEPESTKIMIHSDAVPTLENISFVTTKDFFKNEMDMQLLSPIDEHKYSRDLFRLLLSTNGLLLCIYLQLKQFRNKMLTAQTPEAVSSLFTKSPDEDDEEIVYTDAEPLWKPPPPFQPKIQRGEVEKRFQFLTKLPKKVAHQLEQMIARQEAMKKKWEEKKAKMMQERNKKQIPFMVQPPVDGEPAIEETKQSNKPASETMRRPLSPAERNALLPFRKATRMLRPPQPVDPPLSNRSGDYSSRLKPPLTPLTHASQVQLIKRPKSAEPAVIAKYMPPPSGIKPPILPTTTPSNATQIASHALASHDLPNELQRSSSSLGSRFAIKPRYENHLREEGKQFKLV